MNEAITEGLNWKLDNTRVETDAENVSIVFLYDRMIARIGKNFVQLFDGNYQSNTTKSRLNAICNVHCVTGEGVYQKKGIWYVKRWDNKTKAFENDLFTTGYLLADY